MCHMLDYCSLFTLSNIVHDHDAFDNLSYFQLHIVLFTFGFYWWTERRTLIWNKVRYIQSSMELSTVVNVVRVSHVRDWNQYANIYGQHSLGSALRAKAVQLDDKMKAMMTCCVTLTSVAKFSQPEGRNICYNAATSHTLFHRNRANNRRWINLQMLWYQRNCVNFVHINIYIYMCVLPFIWPCIANSVRT